MSELSCKVRRAGELIEVLSPSVGVWVDRPARRAPVRGGQLVGALDILGRRHPLRLPAEASGSIVGGVGEAPARTIEVAYGTVLLQLDPSLMSASAADVATSVDHGGGLVFRAPSSGRFWRRPSPGDPPLCDDGQEIAGGQAIGLLEVMKTFTRLVYGGDALPGRARVVRVVPADGDDVDMGDVLLELERLS